MPRSFLEVEGLYNPSLRFAFTNITESDFTTHWDKVPITVKPGETIEISNTTPIPGAGHALAIKMTGEMVDKIILGEAKEDELQKNQPYYRSPKGSSLGVPAYRKTYEDQILRQLDPDEESPAIQILRKQMRAEIEAGVSGERPQAQPVHVPSSLEEFAELTANKTVVAEKKPAKTRKVQA